MFTSLKSTLIISLIWHILCAGLIEPTFGKGITRLEFAEVSFLGSILSREDISSENYLNRAAQRSKSHPDSRIELINLKTSTINRRDRDRFPFFKRFSKPSLSLGLDRDQKAIYMPAIEAGIISKYRKESSMMFYPRLPYSFLIYFRDRQKAHIEFRFYISDKGQIAFINRRISSGNLEVDLLASRYIMRHLNLIKDQFPTDSWQTVKIDLTRRDDQN